MAMTHWETVAGGVVAAKGFRVAGVRCGIKRKRRDVALIVCDARAIDAFASPRVAILPSQEAISDASEAGIDTNATGSGTTATGGCTSAAVAGVFTTNVVRAPCVDWSEARARHGFASAIVVNAGNANAGNGERGERDNRQMAQWAADALGMPVDTVLTASTGVIGTPLPMAILKTGIADAAGRLAATHDAGSEAAEAIMTTDTFPKQVAVRLTLPESGATVTIGGMSKGSGMIAPNMATMLGFITTDAAISADVLRVALVAAVAESFNCLTVDGDTSTNDSCFVMASGAANNVPIVTASGDDYGAFADALTHVCVHLAKEIARDGEGATKLVTVRVTGTATVDDARKVAKTIAESPLVKTALFGNDPNWGRILAAAGRAGVRFDPKQATAHLAGTCIFRHGMPAPFDAPALSKAMAVKELTIHVDLGTGDCAAQFYTCDFSYDYVRINAEYHT